MIRTFIWGSCVSRDTFEFLGDEFALVSYIARQSFLSAGNAVRTPPVELDSAFQDRMSAGDLAGDGVVRLSSRRQDVDLVLLDLCDERLGVVDDGQGGFLTRSVDRMKVGVQDDLDAAGTILEFGSFTHLSAWAEALERLVRELENLDLLERTLVIGPPWAVNDENGDRTPSSFGLHARVANELFDLYYEAVRVLGLPIVGRDIEPVAAIDHQWGDAPFHYDKRTYQRLAAEITEHIAGWLPRAR